MENPTTFTTEDLEAVASTLFGDKPRLTVIGADPQNGSTRVLFSQGNRTEELFIPKADALYLLDGEVEEDGLLSGELTDDAVGSLINTILNNTTWKNTEIN